MHVGFPVAAVLLVASTGAAGAGANWSVDAGLTHTDNATLAESGSVSDTLASIGGALSIDRQTRLVRASVSGQGSFQHYMDDTFEDDFVGQAVGDLTLSLIPGRVLWNFEDSYGQVATNPFEPVTPDNRQDINHFTTGPDLRLRFGDRAALQLSAKYGDTHYGSATQSNTRNWGGTLGLERELSRNSSVKLTGSQNRTVYDAPSIPLYDQQTLYATWTSRTNRQSVSADLGASRIAIRNVDDGRINPLLRIGWQRRVTPSWTMDLDLASEYQNAGEQFAQRAARADPGSADVDVSSTPAATYRAGLSLTFDRSRTHFSMSGGQTRLNYVGTENLDQRDTSASVELRRKMTPRLQGFLGYRFVRHNYESAQNDAREQVAEGGLDFAAGRSLFVTLTYRHTDSDGDSAIRTYSDNVVGLKASWRRGDPPRAGGY